VSKIILKILLISPNHNIESLITNILEEANEINYSFLELISIVTKPGQILQTKIHNVFGIRYVDKNGINLEKLKKDIKNNASLNLKWIKIKKWLFKIWTSKTKSERVSFYIVTPDFYNGLKKLNSNIIHFAHYFNGFGIIFSNQNEHDNFDGKNFLFPFQSIILDENKNLKEIILGYVNKTIF